MPKSGRPKKAGAPAAVARTPKSSAPTAHERLYAVVRRIPRGRVATYGQIAELAGVPRHARQVGYALRALGQSDDVPWHRVVNARGEVSPRAFPGYEDLQRALLEEEGVEIARERIDLDRWLWRPRGSERRRGPLG